MCSNCCWRFLFVLQSMPMKLKIGLDSICFASSSDWKRWYFWAVRNGSCQNGNEYIFSIIIHLKNRPESFPIKNKNAENIAQCIMSVKNPHGFSQIIISDQGQEFCNKLNDEFCRFTVIKRSITALYHTQANRACRAL